MARHALLLTPCRAVVNGYACAAQHRLSGSSFVPDSVPLRLPGSPTHPTTAEEKQGPGRGRMGEEAGSTQHLLKSALGHVAMIAIMLPLNSRLGYDDGIGPLKGFFLGAPWAL